MSKKNKLINEKELRGGRETKGSEKLSTQIIHMAGILSGCFIISILLAHLIIKLGMAQQKKRGIHEALLSRTYDNSSGEHYTSK